MDMLGKTLGRFTITGHLGAGGMGEVYRAKDEQLGREVAIKVIAGRIAEDPAALARFELEAKAVAALNHPNILSIHDFGHEGDITYAVMELLEGETLQQRLKQGPLPVSKAVEIAEKIAKGLTAAHGKGIIHRDLKPANIFLCKDGQVKILDFGLAKVHAPVEDAETKSVLPGGTVVGTMMGTVGYMAPEQVRGFPADARSDIFAVGVVLYEMLSGKKAFSGDTASDTLAAILTKDPEPLPPVTPAALDRMVRRCLEKRPEDRFSSTHDLAFALEAVSDSGAAVPLSTPAASTPAAGSWIHRHWLKLLAGLAAAGLLVLAVGWVVWFKGAKPAPKGPVFDPKRIVVAVFENQTGDRSLDPLGRMASDWITQGLSRISELDVVPSTSVLFAQPPGNPSIQAARDPIRALAEATSAGIVVTGTFYLQGQTLQFQARVTDAVRGKLLHSLEPVTGPVAAPMQAIDALRQRVTGAMAVSVEAIHELGEHRPPPYDAYREFIAGFELFGTKDAEALRHFQLAAQIDPDFGAPRLYAAFIYHKMGKHAEAESILHYLEDRRQQLTPLARCWLDCMRGYVDHRYIEALQALREAERLAPQDPMVNLWLGFVAFFADRQQEVVDTYARLDRDYWKHHVLGEWRVEDLARAHHALGNYQRELEVVQRGLESFPESLELRELKARALAALGRLDEANKVADETLLLQSSDATPGDVMLEAALELRAHGHLDASLAMANRATAWYRARPSAEATTEDVRAGLALALALAARSEEARAIYEKLAADFPDNVGYRGSLAVLAAGRGDRVAAQRVSEELRLMERPGLFGANTYQRARIAATLGEKDHAVELLGQAFAEGMSFTLDIHKDSAFEGIRNFPPFVELLKPKG